jgi:hypothetical protein
LSLQNKDKTNHNENLSFPYLSSLSSSFSNFNFLNNKPIIQTKLKVSQPGDDMKKPIE